MLVKLTQQDKANYPGKFALSFMGPWVVVERFSNGVTYRVRDVACAEQLQLTRDQFKVADLPEVTDDGGLSETPRLPRLVIPDVGNPPAGEESGKEPEPQPKRFKVSLNCYRLPFASLGSRLSETWFPHDLATDWCSP